ncbi:MAG TPA: helix-turn-helix transcriptional regulator [Bradyrhizobium sp.]|jgi:DNA-binding CsgD family transcriptional regulator|nr:helix-turn-helix transcriptional regulator [Bradyrhizobium sp.]
MLVRKVQGHSPSLGLGLIPQLVRAAGTADYGPRVLAALQQSATIDSIIVFRFKKNEPARVHALATRRSMTVLDRTARTFAAGFSHLDPNALVIAAASEPCGVFTHTERLDIEHRGYRDRCWRSSGVVDRCSYIGGEPADWWALNLYREMASGRFSETEIDALSEAGTLLTPLTEKHLEIESAKLEGAMWARLENVLGSPGLLTNREKQVCGQMLRGRTTAAIACDLAIGVTSVITYKRRAFSKLGISTRHELMDFCLHRIS